MIKKVLILFFTLFLLKNNLFSQEKRQGIYVSVFSLPTSDLSFDIKTKSFFAGYKRKFKKTEKIWWDVNYNYEKSSTTLSSFSESIFVNDSVNISRDVKNIASKHRLSVGINDVRKIGESRFFWQYGLNIGVNYFDMKQNVKDLTILSRVDSSSSFVFTRTEFIDNKSYDGKLSNAVVVSTTPQIGIGFRVFKDFFARAELSFTHLYRYENGNLITISDGFLLSYLIVQYNF
jgi:hypothetical protein